MSMLKNNTNLLAARMGALLCCSGLSAASPQEFVFRPPEGYMRDLFAPNAPKDPPPLEASDPELAELIQWFEHQPKVTRKKLEIIHVAKKVGRNEPCPCGSGLKFKRCCIDKA